MASKEHKMAFVTDMCNFLNTETMDLKRRMTRFQITGPRLMECHGMADGLAAGSREQTGSIGIAKRRRGHEAAQAQAVAAQATPGTARGLTLDLTRQISTS